MFNTKLTIFLALALVALSTTKTISHAQKVGERSIMRWEHSDDGERFRLEIDGKAEFNDDYTDIRSISQGGYVRIEEDHKGTSRRFEIRPTSDGQLQRSYYV